MEVSFVLLYKGKRTVYDMIILVVQGESSLSPRYSPCTGRHKTSHPGVITLVVYEVSFPFSFSISVWAAEHSIA